MIIQELDVAGWTWLKHPHDGLEKEFRFFSWLEGSLRTAREPADSKNLSTAI
jgi:hypothetical protein